MSGTAKNYDVTRLQKGQSDLWIIGGGVADSATPQLTIASDGTPDATAHPASVHLGLWDDAASFAATPKIADIKADQFEGPVDKYLESQSAYIEATLKQLDPKIIQLVNQHLVYAAASGYAQVTGGGQVVLTAACYALITPKRTVAGKYYVTILFKALGTMGFTTPVGRAKESVYKVKLEAMTDPARTAGRQMFNFYETL